MANLEPFETVIFEKLFDRGGYVLDFNDTSFSRFFECYKINIDDPKYKKYGTSKMKRLRAFWDIENDNVAGSVLDGLLKYAVEVSEVCETDKQKAERVVSKLLGKKTDNNFGADLLSEEFKLNLSLLNIDTQFYTIIEQRVNEIKNTLKHGAALSVIFLCGSTLEGLLQDKASKHAKEFNSAKAAPKKDGKVLPLHEWTLNALIDVAYEVSFIERDIKEFSHALKDFRNYIHPRQQALGGFNPDKHTAEISWKVLQATIASLSGQRSKNNK